MTGHYFELDPPDDGNIEALSLDNALNAIRMHFTCVDIDEAAALENARRRLDALQKIGAPDQVVAAYLNPKVVHVRIAKASSDEHYIEFDLWDEQGVMVYPNSNATNPTECADLANELASVLGYDCSIEEFD